MNKRTSIKAKIKSVVCRFTTIIEYCHDCGVEQPIAWVADNPLWSMVFGCPLESDMGGALCPKCFDKRAEDVGIRLMWTPSIDYRFDADVVTTGVKE